MKATIAMKISDTPADPFTFVNIMGVAFPDRKIGKLDYGFMEMSDKREMQWVCDFSHLRAYDDMFFERLDAFLRELAGKQDLEDFLKQEYSKTLKEHDDSVIRFRVDV